MGRIKLNPYVDLGLSNDPSAKKSTDADPNEFVPDSITFKSDSFNSEKATDLSGSRGSVDYIEPNVQALESSVEYTTSDTGREYKGSKFSDLFFVLAFLAFLFSLGSLIFVLLQYFKII